MTDIKFGHHEPTEVRDRSAQSPMAVFSRGLQVPGRQWKFAFPNGYGASVINDGYGAESGLYELAVLHDGEITYQTPITDDVLGWLTAGQVADHLDEIAALTDEIVVQAQIDRERAKRDERIAELERELADLRAKQDAEVSA